TVRHTRAHLTRAVLEGVAFGLRDGLELMRDAGVGMPGEFRASGGGTKSPLWRQVVADVLDVPVVTVGTAEGAAFGAAVLAAVGAGWFPSVAESEAAMVRTGERTEPADADAYSGAYASYRSLYPALQPVFGRLDS
ncbi:MAG: FGGY-family carbohydrate kinase, partial [Jiangellales bacterium]